VNRRSPLGADLVIPALAAAFAAYFLYSVAGLAWEARANGVLIGVTLLVLIAAQAARILLQLRRGTGDLGLEPLLAPRNALGRRLALAAVAVAFIATLPWLGLTLGLLVAMLAALWVSGVRRPAALALVPLGVAASAYLLFIFVLDSEFPHGPIERLLS
jgi:hypothetical protein